METMELIDSFDKSFCNEELSTLTTDLGDTVIDLLSNNEAINSIPILGLLNGVYKTYKSISTARLIKKIAKFLFLVSDINAEDKQTFLNEVSTEIEDKGSEFLLDIINRFDNINKISILSNLVRTKVEGTIEVSVFVMLCKIIENTPYNILRVLPDYVNDKYMPGETDILSGLGLLYLSCINPDESKYRLNRIGYLLLKHGMDVDVMIPETYPVENSAYAVLR